MYLGYSYIHIHVHEARKHPYIHDTHTYADAYIHAYKLKRGTHTYTDREIRLYNAEEYLEIQFGTDNTLIAQMLHEPNSLIELISNSQSLVADLKSKRMKKR